MAYVNEIEALIQLDMAMSRAVNNGEDVVLDYDVCDQIKNSIREHRREIKELKAELKGE